MKGDFSRDSFQAQRPYSRVLLQQGRVSLDADWNEQVSSLLHHYRVLTQELVGWHGTFDAGFRVSAPDNKTLEVSAGSYYVEGLRCGNAARKYYSLEDLGLRDQGPPWLVYLDVWERYLSPWEISEDALDPALRGLDTAARAKVEWRLRLAKIEDNARLSSPDDLHTLLEQPQSLISPGLLPPLKSWQPLPSMTLVEAPEPDKHCDKIPARGYRGLENQLYRVEIHRADATSATIKWSRDNGSPVYSCSSAAPESQGSTTTPEQNDERRYVAYLQGPHAVQAGDYVEFIDAANGASEDGADAFLARVARLAAEPEGARLELTGPKVGFPTNPWGVRVWNGCGKVACDEESTVEFPLESGIAVEFQGLSTACPGDHWLLPARHDTQSVLWPRVEKDGKEQPASCPARRVRHAYAPLAKLAREGDELTVDFGCYRALTPPTRLVLDESKKEAATKTLKALVKWDTVPVASLFPAANPKVNATMLAFKLQPEWLNVQVENALTSKLTDNLLSVGEVARLSAQEFTLQLNVTDDQGNLKGNVRGIHMAARQVCDALRMWPDQFVTKEDLGI